ncbi:Rha family transcriptional regulator [Clostridium sp.]|uniref:Rha family transcriptional regulator n=1 Tax=Clostridium sp. TaxID=1506 RepID=UPI001A4CA548|nr:Rha family transcriptional regulator [Clostridium sp.]MBK5236686.1 ORF6C domain-containing protein [Clostridium sp.]
MNKLINIKNEDGQLTVTSRQIAETFNREHKGVLDTIRNLTAENYAVKNLMIESNYEVRGKKYPEYLLTKDGFSLLVMGFTGSKALEWKLEYIKAFNEMEQTLKSVQPKLSKELQAIFAIDQRTEELDIRLITLEGSMTIDYSQQEELRTAANKKIIEALGGKDAPAYKECSKKAFSELWKSFKRIMQVNSYRNTAAKEYENARAIIKAWRPNRDLELMILGANSQFKINL